MRSLYYCNESLLQNPTTDREIPSFIYFCDFVYCLSRQWWRALSRNDNNLFFFLEYYFRIRIHESHRTLPTHRTTAQPKQRVILKRKKKRNLCCCCCCFFPLAFSCTYTLFTWPMISWRWFTTKCWCSRCSRIVTLSSRFALFSFIVFDYLLNVQAKKRTRTNNNRINVTITTHRLTHSNSQTYERVRAQRSLLCCRHYL